MFRRIIDFGCVIFINGERCNIRDGVKILRYFSSKTKNITEIHIYDCIDLRIHGFSVSFLMELMLQSLLENGKRYCWKLKVLDFSSREIILGTVRRFLNFAKDTLQELSFHKYLPLSSIQVPSEEVSHCHNLQELDMGGVQLDLHALNPLLRPSSLSLVILQISLFANGVTELVAILKRFRNTLQEIYCTPLGTISLKELLNKFEENDEPVRELRLFNCTWWSNIAENEIIDVKKLFRIFPSLERLTMFEYFIENSLYQFARDFLDLFRYDSTLRKFTSVSSFYRGIGVETIGNRLVEFFPPPQYSWEIKTKSIYTEPDKIVIQRGNAQITLLCQCW